MRFEHLAPVQNAKGSWDGGKMNSELGARTSAACTHCVDAPATMSKARAKRILENVPEDGEAGA